MSRTHTISNSSTFKGWLESMGLDDMFSDPCGCIFGESQADPIPVPGASYNRQLSHQNSVRTRNASMRQSQRRPGQNGKTPAGRQASVEPPPQPPPEPPGPLGAFFSLVGVSTPAGTASGGAQGAAANGAVEGQKPSGPPSLAFWQNRSISLVDMYLDQGDPSEKCGELNFGLEYDFATQTLKLKINQGRDLKACDANGLSDPYVRVTLLPDKKHRLETKIKRRTLNPRWNETFYFEGFPINKLQSRVLHLHCYDYDRFSKDDSIGEIHLPLCQVDFTNKPTYWRPLYPPVKMKLGELLVSLTYLPAKNTLTIGVLKARNLKAKDINGKSDPYVKVWLMFGEKRVEKKKTPIYKCNLNPIFNASFEFDVPWEQIRDCALQVQVMDFDTVGRNELIGKLLLQSKNGSGPSETKQWQDMIAKPRQSIIVWHRLKPGD